MKGKKTSRLYCWPLIFEPMKEVVDFIGRSRGITRVEIVAYRGNTPIGSKVVDFTATSEAVDLDRKTA